MKRWGSPWRLFLITTIVCIPLPFIAVIRDAAYRAANRAVPAWQQSVNFSLFEAIERNDLQAVQLLVRQGADVEAKDSSGVTPLIAALQVGLSAPRWQVATYLLEQGANPNAIDSTNRPIFFQCAENFLQEQRDRNYSQAQALVRLMLDAGVRPHASYRGSDILYHAVLAESIEHVQRLLANGVNPDTPLRTHGTGTSTPLLAAVAAKNPKMVALLLNHGANPNLIGPIYDTSHADSPLNEALYRQGNFQVPLSADESKVVRLLIQHGADVNRGSFSSGHGLENEGTENPQYEGPTPLMWAALSGDVSVAKFILQHGANPQLRDTSGKTALDYARREKHAVVAQVLKAAMKDH